MGLIMSKKTNTVALFQIFNSIDTLLQEADSLRLRKEFKNLDEWIEFKQSFPLSPFQIGLLNLLREYLKQYASRQGDLM
jgi:hypothetical protein